MIQKEAEIEPIKGTEFDLFARWIALPSKLRYPLTHQKFARKFGVDKSTLSAWKHDASFWRKVDKYRSEWANSEYSNVMFAMCDRAKKGDVAAARLYVEMVEKLLRLRETVGERAGSPLTPKQIEELNEAYKKIVLAGDADGKQGSKSPSGNPAGDR